MNMTDSEWGKNVLRIDRELKICAATRKIAIFGFSICYISLILVAMSIFRWFSIGQISPKLLPTYAVIWVVILIASTIASLYAKQRRSSIIRQRDAVLDGLGEIKR